MAMIYKKEVEAQAAIIEALCDEVESKSLSIDIQRREIKRLERRATIQKVIAQIHPAIKTTANITVKDTAVSLLAVYNETDAKNKDVLLEAIEILSHEIWIAPTRE